MVNAHRNPYPGLRPFRPDEEHLFFGRELQVDKMISKLQAQRFLAVVGGSGSGKSSLVNCGLRPALHRGYMSSAGANWRMVQFRPGSDPIRAMTRALAAPGVLFDEPDEDSFLTPEEMIDSTLRLGSLGLLQCIEQAELPESTQLLIVVDQFEELFRFGAGKTGQNLRKLNSEKTAFIKLLLEAVAHPHVPVHIVVTMRSDFLGDCTQFEGLPEAINEGQYLVPRLTRQQIRQAITGPAQVRGEKISPVLTTRLLNDLGDNPDQLSILQHALNRTWAHWENESRGDGQIDLPDYLAIGGLKNALDQHAEKAFDELPDEKSQLLCAKIFKALTDTGTDARGTRRITPMAELTKITNASIEEIVEVARVFRKSSRSFLMPPEGEELSMESDIDISHESLMRLWRRLRLWTTQEASSARTFRNLRETANRHAKGEASLWRGPELSKALEWRKRNQPTEKWAQRYGGDFDVAMNFLHESNEAVREERGKERGRKRARIAFVAMLLVLILPIAAMTLGKEVREQFAKANAARVFIEDLSLFEELHLNGYSNSTLRDFCDTYSPFNWLDTSEPLWSSTRQIGALDDFCSDRGEYFRTSDRADLVAFASHVHRGDLDSVRVALSDMPIKLEWAAYQLLARTAELHTPDILTERFCLAALLGDEDGNNDPELVDARCANVGVVHPLHRSIFKSIGPLDAKAMTIEQRISRLSDDHKYLLHHYGGNVEIPEVKGFSDLHWIYVRMGRAAEDTSSFGLVRKIAEQYSGVGFIFLLWPLWYVRRWWSKRTGRVIGSTPSSHRRLAATLFDGAVSAFLGFSCYASVEFIALMRNISSEAIFSTSVGIVVGLAYLLYSDAILFRYCRSLGKIAFDLRPLLVNRPMSRQISFGDSARRNVPKVMAMLICALFAIILHEDFFHTWMDESWLRFAAPIFAGALALYLIILVVAWNERRIDRKAEQGATISKRLRWITALVYVLLMSFLFAAILVETLQTNMVEFGVFLLLWAMLVLPYVFALFKPKRLTRSRVVDDESDMSRAADMLPRYAPKRLELDSAATQTA